MKTRNLFYAAGILSLALSMPAYAGDVQTPTIAPPPPPMTAISADSPGVQPSDTPSDLLIELLLGILSFYQGR